MATLKTKVLDFKVTVIKARFKDQEVCLELESSQQVAGYGLPIKPIFLELCPFCHLPLHPRMNNPTIGTRGASWQSRHTEEPASETPQVSKKGGSEGGSRTLAAPGQLSPRNGQRRALTSPSSEAACSVLNSWKEAGWGSCPSPAPDLLCDLEQLPPPCPAQGTMAGRGLVSLQFEEAGS